MRVTSRCKSEKIVLLVSLRLGIKFKFVILFQLKFLFSRRKNINENILIKFLKSFDDK